ncbi:hypothetical protein [Flavobacterium sp.]|uniref:hypothetical protein n=1 Tax=Flavobacterium sp. TaxID=239 RepID=UPI00286DB8E6|nr:hypothetical protein [Flavobacterium sp.]
MKKKIFLSILLSFLSCKNTEEKPVEFNAPTAVDQVQIPEVVTKVDSIDISQPEVVKMQELEIPETSTYRYTKVWEDGFENRSERSTAKLLFSKDKVSLKLILGNKDYKLKCIEEFKMSPDGASYGDYITQNGLKMTIGYLGKNAIQWFITFKIPSGVIYQVELSNDKNAWD